MREILFRGKREDCKRWIYGHYRKSESFDRSFIRVSQVFEHLVIPETVGQYTGLTDKNGTKIFEGDILLIDGKFIGVVTYNAVIASFIVEINDTTDKCYHWSPLNAGDIDRHAMLKYTEIIGNIHDNPELFGKEPSEAESEDGDENQE